MTQTSINKGAAMKVSRLTLAALLVMGTTLAAHAQQQQQPGAAAQKESGAASADCARAPNKKHEHGVDRGAGKQAMQPCPQSDAASKPASKLRKTHDSRRSS
ncbi:MAG: hypothetical protein KIT60_20280 [Burkholderiaceae bacterium]|nr:hypothetical protein [Burkholderiaceae bacterium]